MADLARREGARTEFLSSLGQPPRPHLDVAALARIAAIARRFRPHVVHTHTAKAGFLGRLGALAALRPRPVIVHTYHGHVLEGYFGPLGSLAYRKLETLLARRSDCLVGVSQATVDDLVRLGVATGDRFRVIALGLDLEPFADLDPRAGQELREELGFGDEDIVLSYVGRIVPIKRLDVLLRALALTRDAAPLRLLVGGDGEQRRGLESLSEALGIADRVRFLGYRRDLTTHRRGRRRGRPQLRERGHSRLPDRGGGGGDAGGCEPRRRGSGGGYAGNRDPGPGRRPRGHGGRARASGVRSRAAGPAWRKRPRTRPPAPLSRAARHRRGRALRRAAEPPESSGRMSDPQ